MLTSGRPGVSRPATEWILVISSASSGGEARQDSRQTARQHRLPRSGWAAEQQVVPTRRGKLQRPPRPLLAFHIREIRPFGLQVRPVQRELLHRRRDPVAPEIVDRLHQVVQRYRLDPRQRCLRRAVRSAEEPRQSRLARALGRRKNAADRPEPPVQSELADRRVPHERIGRNLPRGGEHRQRNREVEARPFLAELRRRQVDRDPAQRPLELGGRDPAPHPFLGLLAGSIGKPDDCERRQSALEVRLDLDPASVEPDERMRDGSCEHVVTLDNDESRKRDRDVPKVEKR